MRDLFWLHCIGPDGPTVLIGAYNAWTGGYDLWDDNRDNVVPYVVDGKTWLHKWELVRAEPVKRPVFSADEGSKPTDPA